MTRYFSSAHLVFLAIIGFLVFWIGGGMLNREPAVETVRAAPATPRVAASISHAETITPRVSLFGNIVPNQVSVLRARTGGIVETVARQGESVTVGDDLGQLSTDNRGAGVAQATAALASAERDYNTAEQLRSRGVMAESEVLTRFAQLESARASLRAAEFELENTTLRAPISGTISRVMAETGSFVQAGAEVLEVVNNDPLLAQIEVRQNEITSIRLGQVANVTFQGGIQAEGVISFIAPVATAETRTFRVELEVPNPDNAVPAGLSAEISLALQDQRAHRISPALIRLDDGGRIGVMAIDEDGETLRFQQVNIVQARADGIWITGVPDQLRIVTISQGALNDGQKVQVSETPDEYRSVVGGEAPAAIAAN
ncbi:efflux RND transporter periplasmic adaptor subunit [Paracoccus sp. (in: a-proteobacteria)]|uniref:efflux RND transporter periplasmic adaptor subunit n=1 Tax=Paracoccus sp. TaxID=267 RepID=UPI0026E10627|nr:efflux RND transporter periplasmic adaptor subunit [Paracoccus sp. (in: a-proteobacteria)]MDO5646503.1 efflux RND transporter periplasmic adaptor subunit [Paracoccus sp. (in: a-proteobacteria)]